MWGLSAEVAKGQFPYALPQLPKYLEATHDGLYDQQDGLVPSLDRFCPDHKHPDEKKKLESFWQELSAQHIQSGKPYDVSAA